VDYRVPKHFLPSSLKWKDSSVWPYADQVITLGDLDEDIGHTFVHYLYTGSYQTLKTQGLLRDAELRIEHRRSVLAYSAARLYDLDGLAAHAKKEVEKFDGVVSIFNILAVCSDAYQNHPGDDLWLPSYLRANIATALERDKTLLTQDEFLDQIGEGAAFTRVLIKMIGELYIDKASTALTGDKDNNSRHMRVSNSQHPITEPEPELEPVAAPQPEPELQSSATEEDLKENEYEVVDC
jgi:hypothetical protein